MTRRTDEAWEVPAADGIGVPLVYYSRSGLFQHRSDHVLRNKWRSTASSPREERSRARPGSTRTRESLSTTSQTLSRQEIDILIAVGREGTLSAAGWLTGCGVPVVKIPGRSTTTPLHRRHLRLHTALTIATDAIDRLQSTAESISGSS
jgi:6-phosphofructokinase